MIADKLHEVHQMFADIINICQNLSTPISVGDHKMRKAAPQPHQSFHGLTQHIFETTFWKLMDIDISRLQK